MESSLKWLKDKTDRARLSLNLVRNFRLNDDCFTLINSSRLDALLTNCSALLYKFLIMKSRKTRNTSFQKKNLPGLVWYGTSLFMFR